MSSVNPQDKVLDYEYPSQPFAKNNNKTPTSFFSISLPCVNLFPIQSILEKDYFTILSACFYLTVSLNRDKWKGFGKIVLASNIQF